MTRHHRAGGAAVNARTLAAAVLGTGPLAWQEHGLCAQADPDAWFPDKGKSTRAAKLICAHCPVQAPCLDYAIERGERFGVWGGKSERERRHLRGAGERSAA